MDKNTIFGLVLIAAVLIGFSWYSSAQEKKYRASASEQNTTSPAEQPAEASEKVSQQALEVSPQEIRVDSSDVFFASKASDGNLEDLVLENEKIRVAISPRGGMVKEVKLKEYKSYTDFHEGNDNPLLLYNAEDAELDISLDLKEQTLRFGAYDFTLVEQTDSTLTMRLKGQGGETIDLVYKLLKDNYLLNFSIETSGLENLLPARTKAFQVDWADRVTQHEKGFYFENMYSTLTYKLHGDDTEKLSESKTEEEAAKGTVDWIAFKNQYFSAILMAATPLENVNLLSQQLKEKSDSGYLKAYSAEMDAPFVSKDKIGANFQFYFGPNNYRLLQSMDNFRISEHENSLQKVVYLGWPIVKWINRYFTLYVFDFFTKMGLPMGVVLLLITLLLRVIVYVPTRKSFMSSAKMRVLKPKVDEIAAKYPKKEDAMKKQQEMMSLYSQYGVSPMGGCLPMLIQMPIWIAMFNFVPNAIELRQQSFLWAEDLSTYDSLISWDMNIWGIGNHLSLFCLLFCGTNLLYSFMTMRQQKESMSGEQAQQMKMMQWMMMLMPLFFFFLFNKYSAGLNYYYFISLLFSALTMWFLRKTTDDKKLLEKLEANYKANKNDPNKKPSGLAARLEALQKQQEEMLKKQQAARKNQH